uniref:Uncharacterized protein n=1 Tax=Lactuca sativa TaxID=4236 RepID=A0A9R1WG19_LACSA|nr:hypothetical protein LSAT_V11C100024790 [Lactuca sativa]
MFRPQDSIYCIVSARPSSPPLYRLHLLSASRNPHILWKNPVGITTTPPTFYSISTTICRWVDGFVKGKSESSFLAVSSSSTITTATKKALSSSTVEETTMSYRLSMKFATRFVVWLDFHSTSKSFFQHTQYRLPLVSSCFQSNNRSIEAKRKEKWRRYEHVNVKICSIRIAEGEQEVPN